MAVIDTLKLSHELQEKGGFTQAAADAIAEALNNAFGAEVATKEDITLLDSKFNGMLSTIDGKFDGKFAELNSKITMIIWALGINIAATVAVLIKHW